MVSLAELILLQPHASACLIMGYCPPANLYGTQQTHPLLRTESPCGETELPSGFLSIYRGTAPLPRRAYKLRSDVCHVSKQGANITRFFGGSNFPSPRARQLSVPAPSKLSSKQSATRLGARPLETRVLFSKASPKYGLVQLWHPNLKQVKFEEAISNPVPGWCLDSPFGSFARWFVV